MSKAKQQEMIEDAPATDLMAVYEANQTSEIVVTAPAPLLNDKDRDTGLLAIAINVPPINLASVLNTLDEIDSYEEGMSFTPKYKEFEDQDKDVHHRVVFMGFKTIQKNESGELKEINCITWLERNADGSVDAYMNGGAILLSAFEYALPSEPYQITFLGRKKTGSGNYIKDFKVVSLRAAKQIRAN
jgi:hypothetical protein